MSDTKFKKWSEKAPSDQFEDAFRDGVGTCRATCACGRECYDEYNGYDWDEGEFEDLEKRSKEDPDACVALPYSLTLATIDTNTFVLGCPCNGLAKYEKFIRSHALKLAKYLNSYSELLKIESRDTEQKAEQVRVTAPIESNQLPKIPQARVFDLSL